MAKMRTLSNQIWLLIITCLVLLALASWSVLLHQQSPGRQRAAAEAYAAGYLRTQLPASASGIELHLHAENGDMISAFPPIEGGPFGPEEVARLESLIHFYVLMNMSRVTDHDGQWSALGTARITSTNGDVIELPVFETPDGQLGFMHDNLHYKTQDNSKPVLDVIRSVRNTDDS